MHKVRCGKRLAAASTAQTHCSTEPARRPSRTEPNRIATLNGNNATAVDASERSTAARSNNRRRSTPSSRNRVNGPALTFDTRPDHNAVVRFVSRFGQILPK
jgi:hypothetical protein